MADTPHTPRPRRIWRVVLAVSLALNFAVLGMIGGAFLRDGRPGAPRNFELAVGPVGAALTREDRHAITHALRKDRSLRPGRGAQPDMSDLLAVLRADTLDQDALTAALTAPSARMQRIQSAAMAALQDRIAAMSVADRLAFADRIAETMARRGRDR